MMLKLYSVLGHCEYSGNVGDLSILMLVMTVLVFRRTLYLYSTMLTGDIPTGIGNLTALRYVCVTCQHRILHSLTRLLVTVAV